MNGTLDDRRDRPFTLVVCTSCGQDADQVMNVLRRAVRECRHGVMISTGCLQGVLRCRGRLGLHAAVQPCAVDRRPTGAVVRLGPLTTEADAEAIGTWLRTGMPDDGTLPDELRAAPAPQHIARLN
ncbi:hypothetical protein ACWDG1_45905 [Streptomyces sp. NPDC001177]